MSLLHRSLLARSFVSLAACAACVVVLYTLEWTEPHGATLGLHGAFDVAGHLVTALVVWIGARAFRLPVPLWATLLGGVVLDLGHTLNWLGYVNAFEGSSRNGSHSLFVVAILACVGFVDQKRAHVWLGVAMGASSHLWRDMGTGTVALLWPITDTVYGTLFNRYVAVLAGMALVMIGSSALLAVHARSRQSIASGPHQAGPTSQASSWDT